MQTTIKSSQRTLALFEMFSLKQRPLTLKEISTGLGMPLSSTSMLVKSLVELGYLERNLNDRKYYPTLRVSLLGTWIRRRHQRASNLSELLSKVARKTGLSTTLAMRNGIYSQYIIAQEGRQPDRAVVKSGMLYPLACSSTGWCLLTLESKKTIEKIVRRTIAEVENPHWKITAAAAPQHVESTIRQGYAFSKGETVEGRGGIAILLPCIPGAYAMAAGVGGKIEHVVEKKEFILENLKNMAEAVRRVHDQDFPEPFD